MPFGYPDEWSISPWSTQPEVKSYRPAFADDETLKTAFGVALAKQKPFEAALEVFSDDVPNSLWASTNWINDPIVLGARDAYLKTLKKLEKPLDKEELLARLLAFCDEKDIHDRPIVEAKERLNALRLYSDILGFTGKVAIDASTNSTTNNNTNNFMKITLVPGTQKELETKVIDQVPNSQSKMLNDDLPKLKLVSGSG